MKIIYFLDVAKGLGGAGNALIEQASIMNNMHDVTIVIPCDKEGNINQEYKARCVYRNLKYTGCYFKTAWRFQDIDLRCVFDTVNEIYDFISAENYELIHSVQLNVAVEIVARHLKIPHIMNIYSLRKGEFRANNLNIFPKYQSCDSELFCNLWEKEMGMTSFCIRPSAPLNKLLIRDLSYKEQYNILILGHLFKTKNQLEAIKAVKKCLDEGYQVSLTIAGSNAGKYADDCQKYIDEYHLNENVSIVGFQSNIRPLLEKNDALLCTSRWESFPISIVEAITYGLTVISTPVGGVPELLKNKVNAYICKGYDSDSVSESIIDWIKDYKDKSLLNIQQQMKITWDENFSIEAVSRGLSYYYKWVVAHYESQPLDSNKLMVIRKKVDSICKQLTDKKLLDDDIESKSLYYVFLQEKLKTGNAYIWGAGNIGSKAKKIIECLLPDIKINAYIDKNKRGICNELPIMSPGEIDFSDNTYVFLSFLEGQESAIDYLTDKGMEYNENFFVFP